MFAGEVSGEVGVDKPDEPVHDLFEHGPEAEDDDLFPDGEVCWDTSCLAATLSELRSGHRGQGV